MTSLTASPAQGAAGEPVTFSATATAVGCTLGSYTWDFGDGTPETVINTSSPTNSITHAFGTAGQYTVRVTARNGTKDAQGSRELIVTIVAGPSLTPTLTTTPTVTVTPTISTTPTATATPTPGSSGGSGGGCNAGSLFTPASLALLLAPLTFLLRR